VGCIVLFHAERLNGQGGRVNLLPQPGADGAIVWAVS
jgi:hypothetical protein